MSSQIPNDLANRVPENIPAHVEEAALPVNNVVSVAMGVLSNPQCEAGPSSGESSVVSLSQKDLDERDVQARALPLMQGDMSGWDKVCILGVIRLIPPQKREDVIQRALPLMQANMTGLDKTSLLNAIQKTPSEERENVIQQALPLMQGINGTEKAKILDMIREISSGERQGIVQRTLSLMQDDMPGWMIAQTFDFIRKIPSGEREDVIQRALLLMQGNMDGVGKAQILKAIRQTPSEERQDVMQQALPLMQGDMSGWKKAAILNAIRLLPVAERNQRAARALEQIRIDFLPEQQVVNLDTYLARVRQLLETPLNEAFLPVGQDNAMAAAAAAGHAMINVHAGSRDPRTAQALRLLRQSQQMTPEEIQTASKACVKYLEDHECAKALKVIIGPNNPNDYGPFFKPFIINGIHTSGQEVIGRLWQFIQNLSPEQEKEAALHSMIISLNECINEHGERVCDQGKMQHLLIAVLQGRLKGVRIDDSIEIPEAPLAQNAPQPISVEAATEMFFHVEANRAINNLQALLQAAIAFCNDNPLVDRESFIQEIKAYAAGSDIQ